METAVSVGRTERTDRSTEGGRPLPLWYSLLLAAVLVWIYA